MTASGNYELIGWHFQHCICAAEVILDDGTIKLGGLV
jgi:hypothetical protein